jgi:hypothetical protein
MNRLKNKSQTREGVPSRTHSQRISTATPTVDFYWRRRGKPHTAPSGSPRLLQTTSTPLRLPLECLLPCFSNLDACRNPSKPRMYMRGFFKCRPPVSAVGENEGKPGRGGEGLGAEGSTAWGRMGCSSSAPNKIKRRRSRPSRSSRVGAGGVLPFCVREFRLHRIISTITN